MEYFIIFLLVFNTKIYAGRCQVIGSGSQELVGKSQLEDASLESSQLGELAEVGLELQLREMVGRYFRKRNLPYDRRTGCPKLLKSVFKATLILLHLHVICMKTEILKQTKSWCFK